MSKIMTYEEFCQERDLQEWILSPKTVVDKLNLHRNEVIKDRKLLQKELGETSPEYSGKQSLRPKYLEVLNAYNNAAKLLRELIDLEKSPSQK
jgi:hypothetical protein